MRDAPNSTMRFMAAALEHGAEKAEEQATPPTPHFPQVFIPGGFKGDYALHTVTGGCSWREVAESVEE